MELYTTDKDGKKTDAHFHMDYLNFQDKNREKLNKLLLKREELKPALNKHLQVKTVKYSQETL